MAGEHSNGMSRIPDNEIERLKTEISVESVVEAAVLTR